MQIAYAGVSPDPQSLPWAPGMGGTAAPVGTLAGAPADGLDFLTALLAQTTTPEVGTRAPVRSAARVPVIGLAQALASADASCPNLSFAGSGDAAHTAPAPSGEVALDPPPAARVDEKRALLAGALAILPAPWTLPVLPASLSAAPASEAATPHVEVSAREKLLALIAMAQGVTSSVMLPDGPGGNRFTQTSPLIQAMFAATSDFEQGQTVVPQTEGLLATQDLPAGEPPLAASAVLRPPIATVSSSSVAPQPPSVSPEAPEARVVPIPSAIATSTTVQAAPAAGPAPAHRDALAADPVDAPLRQSIALPGLPPGERVVLEAAPTRPQPMASGFGLEQAPRASSPFPHRAAAPAPIAADRSGRFEPTLAVAANGSVRKEEQPLPDSTSAVHQPTEDVVASSAAERAPLSASQRLAWEAYLASQGEPSAHVRSAAPVATTEFATRTVAASLARRSLAGLQEGNRPSDPALAALPAVDRQPGSSPAASPAHPIAPSSTARSEPTASWRPAPDPTASAAREEHESSSLRRASAQPASASVRLETPTQPQIADLAPASAPAVDRVSSRPPVQPADGPARREASAQPPIADVVSVPTPREGPSIVAGAAADPALEAEASEGFQELLDRIQIAVRRGESTWRLQLRPPSLGRLEVHLTAGARGLEIVMRTETAEAQAFLQANLPELSRGLDQRGVVVEHCEVSCGQPGTDPSGASGEDRQQAGAAWQFAQPAAPLPVSTARRNAAPTTNSARTQGHSLVDLQA